MTVTDANHLTAMPDDACEEVAGASQAGNAAVNFRTPGTYSINRRYSFSCSTERICTRGLELCVIVKPKVGDAIDAIFDIIGRLQGDVCELTRRGFILALDADVQAGLYEQIAFLADPSLSAAQRRHFRITPRHRETTIRTADRTAYPAQIVDFSISGASIETDAPIRVGEMVEFARLSRAMIVRIFGDRCFGVEFLQQFRPHEFSWNIRL